MGLGKKIPSSGDLGEFLGVLQIKICAGGLKSVSSIGSNAEFSHKLVVVVVVFVDTFFLISGEGAECLRTILLPALYFKRIEVHKIITTTIGETLQVSRLLQ